MILDNRKIAAQIFQSLLLAIWFLVSRGEQLCATFHPAPIKRHFNLKATDLTPPYTSRRPQSAAIPMFRVTTHVVLLLKEVEYERKIVKSVYSPDKKPRPVPNMNCLACHFPT